MTGIVSEPKPDQKLDLTGQTLQKQPEDRNYATEPEEHHDMMAHKYQTPTEIKDLTGIISEPIADQKTDLTDQIFQKQQVGRDDPTELEEHHEIMRHQNETPKENKDLTGIVSDPKEDQKMDLNDQILQKQQDDRDDPTEPDEPYEPEEQHEMMPHENQTPKKKDLTGIVSEPKPDQKPDLTD